MDRIATVVLLASMLVGAGCGASSRDDASDGFGPNGDAHDDGNDGGASEGGGDGEPGGDDEGTGTDEATDETEAQPLFDVGDGGTGDPGLPPGGDCDPTDPLAPAQPCEAVGIVMEPPFDQDYTCWNLGPVPGVPLNWGGINVHPSDPDVLIIGGDSNEAIGRFYGVRVARDSYCHVIGFADEPVVDAMAGEYNDGNIEYHPESDVLLYTRWPVNELGQIKPGSMVTDKVVPLGGIGVAYSLAGLSFVPWDFPGAGGFKMVSWPDGQWYRAMLAVDASGTYDVTNVEYVLTLPGGPEGVAYIHPGNPGFDTYSMLISDWTVGRISAYETDSTGDPVLPSRRLFVQGLDGAEGAFVDRESGDFLFATWGGDNVLIAIHGFSPPPPPEG